MLERGFNAGLLVSAPRWKWKKGSNSGLWVWLEEASVQGLGRVRGYMVEGVESQGSVHMSCEDVDWCGRPQGVMRRP